MQWEVCVVFMLSVIAAPGSSPAQQVPEKSIPKPAI